MIFYTAFTLVDITQTGITRNRKGEEKQRHQQRNWETVLQVIGLRAQPQMIEGPYDSEYELTDGGIFGEMFRGKHMVWHFSFGVDIADTWKDTNENPTGLLDKDFAEVPIIQGLNETAKFMLPIFYPHGAIKNIHFINQRVTI
jgi:hypothetical protein